MQIVIAALSKALKLSLGNLDIYLNVAGGLRVTEPAVDLAAAVSIASTVMSKPLRERTCVFGEVGLLGELRPVGNVKNRISEAKRLGFSDFVTPDKFRTLEEAVRYALGD
jgi:DNA repair protein RadA/Sms